jgi:hypothetical protein
MLEYLETVSASGMTGWIPDIIGITFGLNVVGAKGPLFSIKMADDSFNVSFGEVAEKGL